MHITKWADHSVYKSGNIANESERPPAVGKRHDYFDTSDCDDTIPLNGFLAEAGNRPMCWVSHVGMVYS